MCVSRLACTRRCDALVDQVAASHFPGVDVAQCLQRPMLYSNWLKKAYQRCATADKSVPLTLTCISPPVISQYGSRRSSIFCGRPIACILRGGARCAIGDLRRGLGARAAHRQCPSPPDGPHASRGRVGCGQNSAQSICVVDERPQCVPNQGKQQVLFSPTASHGPV